MPFGGLQSALLRGAELDVGALFLPCRSRDAAAVENAVEVDEGVVDVDACCTPAACIPAMPLCTFPVADDGRAEQARFLLCRNPAAVRSSGTTLKYSAAGCYAE